MQNLNFLDFNTCISNLKENQMIPSENISKEDSLIANAVPKTSTACPNEQSEILASTKDTISQEAPNTLDLKENRKVAIDSGSKGHYTSETNFLVPIFSRKRTKLFFDFCPSL